MIKTAIRLFCFLGILFLVLVLTSFSTDKKLSDAKHLTSRNQAIATSEKILSYAHQGAELLYPNNLIDQTEKSIMLIG
jgi:hypothetical protein